MSKFTDVNRKHYRFPAYKDDEGVKLHREKRNLFAKDRSWLLTDEEQGRRNSFGQTTAATRPATLFKEPAAEREDRTLRRSRKATTEKQGHTLEQEAELKKHRENLPDYSKKIQPTTDKVGRTSLFGKEYKRSTYKVKNRHQTPVETPSLKRQYSGRSYFVPKYIPASIIPDEVKPEVSESELLQSMKKTQDSYLLFDSEPSAYQEKKEGDPAVKKFHTPQEDITVSRGEFRQMEPEKKNKVLDKSLQGLIEEGQTEMDKNGYFQH